MNPPLVLMAFVESTLQSAICRLDRIDRILDTVPSRITADELGKMQAHVLLSRENIQSAMRLLGIDTEAVDYNPTLRSSER